MPTALDGVFVEIKHEMVMLLPEDWRSLGSAFLSIAPVLALFPLLFALTTWAERRLLARIQNRLGPNRVGPWGLFQPIADGLKMLTKEDVVPARADGLVHFLAPIALVVPVLLSFSVIPYGRGMVPLELETSALFFFAVGASAELAVFMAGWSSRNKYALLGALRAMAQMFSYAIPLILAAVPVLMISGTLSLSRVVADQGGNLGWYVFTPWGALGFLLFLVGVAAESNRSPFDIPEGESEIVAGYFLEYSGFKFALFFLGEYLGLFAGCGVAVTLFLGGWQAPLPLLEWIPSWAWFFGKWTMLILLFIWVRATVPRLRMDQLMGFAWKFLIPLGLMNLVVAGLWHWLGRGWMAWVVTGVLVVAAYGGLGRGLTRASGVGPRTYRLVG